MISSGARPPTSSGAASPAELSATARHAHGLLEVLPVAVLLALFVRTFLFQAFVVPTPSMEDTVLVGDYLLVNKFVYAPHAAWEERRLPFRAVRRAHVIVFRSLEDPRNDLIKRVVAVPGDSLQIRNRILVVNGEPQREPWARHSDPNVRTEEGSTPEDKDGRDQMAQTRIPDASYFVMGDNRENSNDSRFWGPVPAQNLKGRALIIYWSLSSPASAQGRNPLRSIADFFRNARWFRMLRLVR
jgi:signal peptidase I